MQSAQSLSHNLKAVWNKITVEYTCSDLIGEYHVSIPKRIIGVALAPQERVTWRTDNQGSSQTTPLLPRVTLRRNFAKPQALLQKAIEIVSEFQRARFR